MHIIHIPMSLALFTLAILAFLHFKAFQVNRKTFKKATSANESSMKKEEMLNQISLQKINQELSAMYAISKEINSTLNIDVLFHDIYKFLKNMIDYDFLAIMLLDDEKKYLQIKYWSGPYIDGLTDYKFYLDGEGVCALCAREKRPIFIEDVKDFEGAIILYEDLKQELVAPLLFNDELIGVFALDTFKENNFDNEKLSTLCSFAGIASTALYNAKVYNDLKKTYISTAKALAKAIEAKDINTKGHCDRVTELSLKTAEYLGFDDENINKIKIAAILHDIGKIGIPIEILNKPSPLTPEESYIIKRHPTIGYKILSDIDYLKTERKIIFQHHERYDGKGYPLGLKGEEILKEAKILALADAFDAMTAKRPYRKSLTNKEALQEIKRSSGTQFDPTVASVFIEMIEKEYC